MSEVTVQRPTPPPTVVTIALTEDEARALSAYPNAESEWPVYKARKTAAAISFAGVYTVGTKLKVAGF